VFPKNAQTQYQQSFFAISELMLCITNFNVTFPLQEVAEICNVHRNIM